MNYSILKIRELHVHCRIIFFRIMLSLVNHAEYEGNENPDKNT